MRMNRNSNPLRACLLEGPLEPILNSIPGGVFAFAPEEGFVPVFVNRPFLDMMGAESVETLREGVKGDYWQMMHPDDVETAKAVYARVSRVVGDQDHFECRLVTQSGRIRLVRIIAQAQIDQKGRLLLVNFVVDLGMQNTLDAKSQMDAQTGLFKMHAFFSLMTNARRQIESGGEDRQLAVLFFDVINFRQINLHYGVAAGDDFLNAIGKILQMAFPEYGTARFGGDQFAVLVDNRDLEARANHARTMICQMAPSSVDCSVGACVWDKAAVTPEEVCNRAKLACDENRKHVNTFFSFYTQESGKALKMAEYVASHVDEAVDKGWIQVYYQPIVRAISNQICGMEALVRWIDPKKGFLFPDVFISALEETQQIWKLDLCVIRQVIEGIAEREKQGAPDIHISVNLSRVDFLCCDIFGEMEAMIQEYDVSRGMLHIEVTESILTSSETKIFQALDRFREAGYEIWIDDFGSGYSTLNLLKDYDFDVLKLDMGFLRKDTPRSREIVSSVIAMDKKIGGLTLAEGVETEEQADFLKRSGCDFLQGYYFSKPMPYDKALRNCMEKGATVENVEQKPYYDAVQQVNFMTDLPLMLIEEQHQTFRILYVNDVAMALFAEDGVETQEAVEARLNDGHHPANRELYQAARYAIQTGKSGELYYAFHGQELLCRYRLISKTDSQYLFVVNVFDSFKTGERLSEKTRMLMSLRYFYQTLFHLDLTDNTVTSIQFGENGAEGDNREPICGEDGRFSPLFPPIFAADQKHYAAFIEPATLSSRLAQAESGILESGFRTADDRGRFNWMSHRIIRIPGTAREQFLYAVRAMDMAAVKEEQARQQQDPYASLIGWNTELVNKKVSLWDDLMLYMPVPLFWKDRHRRFLGANQAFLDYYGFDSPNQILGKTDEEMFWHLDNGPYHEEELAILHTGARSSNVPGKCIARGVARDIYATKWPLYRDGQIVGLMGYFLDDNMRAEMRGSHGHADTIDPVTGLENAASFTTHFFNYDSDYRLSRRPYGLIFATVPELPKIGKIQGKKALEAVLRACADAIVKQIGNGGIAARISASHFAILCEYASPQDIESLSQRIKNAINGIRKVGDMRCVLEAEMHVVYADELPSFEKALLQEGGGKRPDLDWKAARGKALRELLDSAGVGCYILSIDHRVQYWNAEAENLLGYAAEEMLGRDCFESNLGCSFTSGIAVPDHRCPAIVALATGQSQTMQMFMHRSDGKDILIRNTLIPLQDEAGKTNELVALFMPLTDASYDDEMIRDVYEVATRDPITCLPGRKYMDLCLREALETYRRTGNVFAVLFADADDFHGINNRYGHQVGDEVLQAFGVALRQYGRRIDRFCRWGGDEFVGLLQLRDRDELEGVAKRFSQIAEEIDVRADSQRIHFHISIGITAVRSGDTATTLVNRADQYMYLSKGLPGDQVVTDLNAASVKAQKGADNHDLARIKKE